MRVAYYPGCSLMGTGREYDESFRAMCGQLDVELAEVHDWNCCGASSAIVVDHDLSVALPARTLALAEPMGLDLAVPCAACYNRLKSAQKALRDEPEVVERIKDSLPAVPDGRTRVLNVLELLVNRVGLDALRQRVTMPLTGLKPAAYYGCLLVRPPDVCQFDDPENPTYMERVIEGLGAEPVTWYAKTDCCGASLATTRREVVTALCGQIASRARTAGANCLVVACPLCHMNMDSRQPRKMDWEAGEVPEPLPVFYVSEMVGLAVGLRPSELDLGRHLVSVHPLLDSLGLWRD
jgi:heterodisulfide reductase subunit B